MWDVIGHWLTGKGCICLISNGFVFSTWSVRNVSHTHELFLFGSSKLQCAIYEPVCDPLMDSKGMKNAAQRVQRSVLLLCKRLLVYQT